METFWYIALTCTLAAYVVLDGFDFGVGIIYPYVARTESDQRAALASIGPIWNGNEVWLIASGGLLFFAFPRAYAAGFSGFYLALMLVLWLLIFRGLALELRSHLDHPLWHRIWDVAFCGASVLLAFVFGAALGNLIRGVPLNADGYFFVALWTDFSTGPNPGILDWFTVSVGLMSVAALAWHGSGYLTLKTDGEMCGRARQVAAAAGWITVGLAVLVFVAISMVQPILGLHYSMEPVGYLLPSLAVASVVVMLVVSRGHSDARMFLTSSLFILTLLATVAWGMYPNILLATTDASYSLTVFNAAAGTYGLRIGFWWFIIGAALIVAYQIYAHWTFWGKVPRDVQSH